MITQAELRDMKEALVMTSKWEDRRREKLERAAKQSEVLRARLDLKKLIAVHLTNYFPENGIIKTTGQAVTAKYKKVEEYIPRETIHFTLNGPVGGHAWGEWEGSKYLILIPLSLIFNRVYNFTPEDLFLFGNLKLPKGSEIHAHARNLRNVKPGNAKMIPLMEGESTHQACIRRLTELGYGTASFGIGGGGWSFSDQASAIKVLGPILAKSNIPFSKLARDFDKKCMTHMGSIFEKLEETTAYVYNALYEGKKINGRDLDEYLSLAEYITNEISTIIKRQTYSKYVIPEEEILALTRLQGTAVRLVYELKLLKQRINSSYNKIKKIDDLDESEAKWLMREFSLLKKLESVLSSENESKVKRLVRKIGRVEKKIYNTYKELMDRLSELKKDHNFTMDVSDIENQLNIWEAFLATTLSRESGKLSKLVKNKNWHEVEEKIKVVERFIINIQVNLKELHKILDIRVSYLKNRT